MNAFRTRSKNKIWPALAAAAVCAVTVQAASKDSPEIVARAQIAAATLADAVVVDCQLPGRLTQLGGMHTYLTPGVLTRLSAIDCRTRGGEYTVGDLASGTLSLARWLPLAEKSDVQAQYYVARIYANGMDGVAVDYSRAADWYQRAAQKKYPPAMQELGYLYEQGLGVQQDPLAGLNLQREASGLGEDLDYSWKIAATREEADKQIAAVTQQLEAANDKVRDLGVQLDRQSDTVLQSREQLAKQRARVADLRAQLEQAKSAGGGQSAARIQELALKLVTDEGALAEKQRRIDELSASLAGQQSQVSEQLARSQAANSKLNELLASGRAENEGLHASVAQSELRLNQAQQELSTLRASYLQETGDLAARSEQLQQLRAHGADSAQALLAGKQRELDQQRLQQLSAQLAEKTQDLEERQRRITALQLEADQLREAYTRARGAHDKEAVAANDEQQRDRDALRVAQDKIAKQDDRLQHLELEVAARKLELIKLRESLTQQAAGNEIASQKRIATLETDLRDKDKEISELRSGLAKAGDVPRPAATAVANLNTRGPRDTPASGGDPASLLRMVRRLGSANYHALVIGNSSYRLMPGLKTPISDARDVADVLKSRYGFDVKLLTDVTRDQIMAAMNEYARTLTDSDRLLIYYAGHGGTKIFPPERAFWLGVDADPELPSSWLSAQTVADAIWQIHARHILLVADSCFSSVITHPNSTTLVRADDEHGTAIRWNKAARMVLTSGQNEPVVDRTSATASHSLFADTFITVLRQNNILLTGEMLAHEVSSRMFTYAARTGLKQTPTYSNLQDPQHKFGDFFFVPVPAAVQVASLNQ